jgi:hypothetical protein
MEDAPRRRAVRQLAHLPNQPAAPSRVKVAVLEVEAAPPKVAQKPAMKEVEGLCGALLLELRSAIRGRTLAELTSTFTHAEETTLRACRLLEDRGQVVRRGSKYFVA